MRVALAFLLAVGLARADEPATEAPAPAVEATPDVTAQAEAMLTDAVRVLAEGDVDAFLTKYCGVCETQSAKDDWRRYQLASATKSAPSCLYGDPPGSLKITRWKGDLATDGSAKAYLDCNSGQQADQQARLPVPVTIERRDGGELKITQLSI